MPNTPTPEVEAPEVEAKGQTSATLTVEFARQRDAEGNPIAVTTTLLSGTANAEQRKARNTLALTTAGLIGGTFTPLPLADSDAGVALRKSLTPQRMAVLVDCAEGWSYNEMADRLHLSVQTVKKHCANLYGIFGVHTKVECVVEAVRAGILPPLPAPSTPRRRRAARPTTED